MYICFVIFSKGEKGKKGNDSSSSRSQLDTPNSLFHVMVSFNFHLCLFSIIYSILLLFLFVGHFGESAMIGAANGGIAG
jgi:hypothetical protein